MEELATRPIRVVDPEIQTYFRDVFDHLIRAREQIAAFDELPNSILQAHLAQVTVAQNEDMRKITAWAAVIAVPTMVCGVYGMNFDHMPELHWRFGYPLVSGGDGDGVSDAVPGVPAQRLALSDGAAAPFPTATRARAVRRSGPEGHDLPPDDRDDHGDVRISRSRRGDAGRRRGPGRPPSRRRVGLGLVAFEGGQGPVIGLGGTAAQGARGEQEVHGQVEGEPVAQQEGAVEQQDPAGREWDVTGCGWPGPWPDPTGRAGSARCLRDRADRRPRATGPPCRTIRCSTTPRPAARAPGGARRGAGKPSVPTTSEGRPRTRSASPTRVARSPGWAAGARRSRRAARPRHRPSPHRPTGRRVARPAGPR